MKRKFSPTTTEAQICKSVTLSARNCKCVTFDKLKKNENTYYEKNENIKNY